ncbi:RNA polymerase sigma factor [Intrasporangium mesophilum]
MTGGAGQPFGVSRVVPGVRVIVSDPTDRAAGFRGLFDAHATRAVRFAALLGAEDPEDVVQDAFCRLYERYQGGTGDLADASAYLNRVIVNLVRDRHRRRVVRWRRTRLERRDAERHAESAEEASLRTSEASQVLAALDRLPERRREAVVLRYWLDLPYAEIATLMGTTVGAAKSAVSRGLDDLHRHLEDR